MFGHFSMGSCGPTQKKKKKYYNTNNKAKKNKSSVSKLPRAFVFRCAFDSAKFKVWIFFCSLDFFFFSFLWLACQKTQEKIWQTQWNTLNNKLLQLLCSALYLVHPKSSSIFQSCDRLKSDVCCSEKKNVKKNAFRSGLSICHELWDIAFIFFSLMKRKIIITLTSILYYLAFWDLNSWNQ